MSNATPSNPDPCKPIRILSLDGGGVRGLSSLYLLRDLMTRLGRKRGITPPNDLRPCDCFDLIVGTGTGGISALFLGRMRMTVDEAIEEYLYVAESTFKPPSSTSPGASGNSKGVLDGPGLEKSIRDVASRFLKNPNAILEDSTQNPMCRTVVLAARSARTDAPPHIFRSYSTDLPACRFAIHEVARATVAVGGLFPPVKLGNPPVEFVNSELVDYNNPGNVAVDEATQIWSSAQHNIACVISFGTGLQKIVQVEDDWKELVDVSARVIQDCERVHAALSRRLQIAEMPYFRFNVTHGLDVQAMEWKKSKEQMVGITEGYTREPAVAQSFQTCVNILDGEPPAGKQAKADALIGKYLPMSNPAPSIFHGRDNYVQEAVDLLLQNKNVHLAILGPGGIGKTSIAQTILNKDRIKTKFDTNRYFVSCEGISSGALLVNTLCEVFALRHPASQNDLLVFLIKLCTSKPLLLILDNFETVWEPASSEAEDLLATLGQVTGIYVVLTMCGTEKPSGLSWATLPIVTPLDPVASQRTFLEISNRDSDANLDKLLDKLDHIPLAVTLMAHLGQTETPSYLLTQWEREQTKLLSHAQDQSRLKNLDVSIKVSLESPRMQACPQALLLLSVIALLPAGIPRKDLPRICPNISDLDLAVTTLYHVGLASYDSMQTLYMLSPISLYILEKHPLKQPFLNDVYSFYFGLASLSKVHSGEDIYISNYKILHQAKENLEAILTKALLEPSDNQDDIKIQAALDWTRFLHNTTPHDDIIKLALELANKNNKSSMLHALCLQSLGNVYHLHSNYPKALENFFVAQTEFQSLDDQLGAAECLLSRAAIYHMLSDYPKAQEMISAAQTGFKAIGDGLGAARCLQLMGNIFKTLHEYSKAQEMLSEAQAAFQTVNDRLGAAQCLQTLGGICYMQAEYPKAQEKLKASQAEFQSLGYKLGVAQCLQSLGDVYCMLSDYPKAQEMLSTAKVEFESLDNKLGVAQCLRSQGDIFKVLNDYPKAQEILSEAQKEFQSLGNHQGIAWCLQTLGDIYLVLSDYTKAQEKFSAAQTEFQLLGNHLGIAQSLKSLGKTYWALSDYPKAQETLSEAKAEFESLDNHLGAAQCMQSLGNICRMLSDYSKAKNLLSKAQAEFQTLGDQLGAAQCLKSLGHTYHMLGDTQRGQEMISKAQTEFRSLGDQHEVAECLQFLGSSCSIPSEASKAQELFSAAQSEFESLGNHLGVAQCLQSLGSISCMLSDFSKGHKMLSTAKAEFESLGNRQGAAQCLKSLANIHLIFSDYQKAGEMLSVAQAEFQSLGDQRGVAGCLELFADMNPMLENQQNENK